MISILSTKTKIGCFPSHAFLYKHKMTRSTCIYKISKLVGSLSLLDKCMALMCMQNAVVTRNA